MAIPLDEKLCGFMLSGQAIQRGRKSGRICKGGLLCLSNGVVSAPIQGFLGNGTQVNFIRRQILHKRRS